MLTIKNPDFDGKFYPKDTVELENQLEKCFTTRILRQLSKLAG